jgi:ABC-2 type transport system ATP-binding protein
MEIRFEGLRKRFGRTAAVDDLSFAVRPGAVTGFVGPNGSGKSTTMRLALGLDRPDAGRVSFDGASYAQLTDPLRSVGALLEAKAVHPRRSARNHLRAIAATNRIPAARVDEVLALVGLADVAGRRAGGYSLGMGQRLGLALALLGDPPVLMLDEPANGLDPEGIVWIRRFVRFLADDGRTVLVSSHVLSELGQVVDDVVVIGTGRLLAAGTRTEVLGDAAGVTVVSPDTDRLARLAVGRGARLERSHGSRLELVGIDAVAVGELAAANGVVLHELTPREPSLEQAFLRLTAGSQEFRAGERGRGEPGSAIAESGKS